MAKRAAGKVKHSAVYAPFRKALEALGDWRRDVTFPNRPEVGTNFCLWHGRPMAECEPMARTGLCEACARRDAQGAA